MSIAKTKEAIDAIDHKGYVLNADDVPVLGLQALSESHTRIIAAARAAVVEVSIELVGKPTGPKMRHLLDVIAEADK